MVGMGRGKGREWGEGRELGKAEWEREREGGREAGRVGYSGRERWVGGGEGLSPSLGLSIKPPTNPAGIPRMVRQGHVSLGFKVPALGGCREVRASESSVGTYPHDFFLDQTRPCPCVHT